jgi:hypothetical protein
MLLGFFFSTSQEFDTFCTSIQQARVFIPFLVMCMCVAVPPDNAHLYCGRDNARLQGRSGLWPGERCRVRHELGNKLEAASLLMHTLACNAAVLESTAHARVAGGEPTHTAEPPWRVHWRRRVDRQVRVGQVIHALLCIHAHMKECLLPRAQAWTGTACPA